MADLERKAFWHCLTATDWEIKIGSPSGGTYTVAWQRMPSNHPVHYDWICSCRSFQFQKGTDSRGYCKHIRRVIAERARCGWMQFTDGGDVVINKNGKRSCPQCGGPVAAQEWGV